MFLEIQEIVKHYKARPVLDKVSFDVKQGETLGILGPNGAGKSTLATILAAVVKPDSGKVLLEGKSIHEKNGGYRSRIGYVPQDIALYSALSVRDNMSFWADLQGLDPKERVKRIKNLLKEFNLYDRLEDKVSSLSGGMKRRLNVAVALIHKPELIILDEPMNGADSLSVKVTMDKLLSLKKEGYTILISDHHLEGMADLCDRIAILDEGRLIHLDKPEAVLTKTGAHSLEQLMLSLLGGKEA